MDETREDTDPGQLHVITAMRVGEAVQYSLVSTESPDSRYSLTQTAEGYTLTTRDGETLAGAVPLMRAHSAVAESPYAAWALPGPSKESPEYRRLVAALRLSKAVGEYPVSPGGLHGPGQTTLPEPGHTSLLLAVHLAWEAGVSISDIAEIVHVPDAEVEDAIRPYRLMKAAAEAKAQEGPEYLTLKIGPDGGIAGVSGPPPGVTGPVPRGVRAAGPITYQSGSGAQVVQCPECGTASGLLFAQLDDNPAVRAWCPGEHSWTTELSEADWRQMLKLAFPGQD